MYSICKKCFLIFALFCIHYAQSNNVHREYYSEASDVLHTTERNRYESMLCMKIQPQHSLNIDYITGEWFGNEIIMHTQDVPGVYDYNSCVEVRLTDISDQMQYYESNYRDVNTQHRQQQQQPHSYQQTQQHNLYNNNNNNRNDHIGTSNEQEFRAPKFLSLVWHENDDNLEYTFNYTSNNPGLWTNIGEQRGSLVALNKYTQFMGTVQVVKAVNDQLVLTFCGSGIRSSIYTIILSRKVNGLTHEDVSSIRNLLARRGLSTDSIRKVCGHGAGSGSGSSSAVTIASTVLLLVAMLIAVRRCL